MLTRLPLGKVCDGYIFLELPTSWRTEGGIGSSCSHDGRVLGGKLCCVCVHRLFSVLQLVVLVWVQGVGVTEKAYHVGFTSCGVCSKGDAVTTPDNENEIEAESYLEPSLN